LSTRSNRTPDAVRLYRAHRKRPPRTLRLAGLHRWPRPLAFTMTAALLMIFATIYRPLLYGAVAIWAAVAAGAVIDARLRGRHGLVAGICAAVLGPLPQVVTSLAFRRSVRKVGTGFERGLPLAILAAIGGGVAAYTAGSYALDRLAFTVAQPSPAMAGKIRKGDRLLISAVGHDKPFRGEMVMVESFPRAAQALGRGGRYLGALRIVGLGGEVIGAQDDGSVYLCRSVPDILRPIDEQGPKTASGCLPLDETAYVSSRGGARDR